MKSEPQFSNSGTPYLCFFPFWTGRELAPASATKCSSPEPIIPVYEPNRGTRGPLRRYPRALLHSNERKRLQLRIVISTRRTKYLSLSRAETTSGFSPVPRIS